MSINVKRFFGNVGNYFIFLERSSLSFWWLNRHSLIVSCLEFDSIWIIYRIYGNVLYFLRGSIFYNLNIFILNVIWSLNFWSVWIGWWLFFDRFIEGLFGSYELIGVEINFCVNFNFNLFIFQLDIQFSINIFILPNVRCISLIIIVFICSVS